MPKQQEEFTNRIERENALENVIDIEVTMDTDIMDFFLIAGYERLSDLAPIYLKATNSLKKEIDYYLKRKSSKFTRLERRKRTRFQLSVFNFYPEIVKSISELKYHIETNGIVFKGMGYGGLSEFNKSLQRYQIDIIKVGGKHAYERILNRYGLEKAKNIG